MKKIIIALGLALAAIAAVSVANSENASACVVGVEC